MRDDHRGTPPRDRPVSPDTIGEGESSIYNSHAGRIAPRGNRASDAGIGLAIAWAGAAAEPRPWR
jgi:hypothetical protein